MSGSGCCSIFLVEDEVGVLKALVRQASVDGLEPIPCATDPAAIETIDGLVTAPRAALIDVDLGLGARGDGFDVIVHLRKRFPASPMLIQVMSGVWERRIACRCYELGVPFVPKMEFPLRQVRLFFERAKAPLPSGPPRWIEEEIARVSIEAKLTSRQTEVVDHALRGVRRRSELAEVMGLSENTLKTHVRQILAKTAAESLDDLVATILQRVRGRPYPAGVMSQSTNGTPDRDPR